MRCCAVICRHTSVRRSIAEKIGALVAALNACLRRLLLFDLATRENVSDYTPGRLGASRETARDLEGKAALTVVVQTKDAN
jgi:hypothetical protein